MTNGRQINPSSASCFCQYVLSQGQEMKLSQGPKGTMDLASRSPQHTIYTVIWSWFMDLPPFCTSTCQISLETSHQEPDYLHLLTHSFGPDDVRARVSYLKVCVRTVSPGAVWPLTSAYPPGFYQFPLKPEYSSHPVICGSPFHCFSCFWLRREE